MVNRRRTSRDSPTSFAAHPCRYEIRPMGPPRWTLPEREVEMGSYILYLSLCCQRALSFGRRVRTEGRDYGLQVYNTVDGRVGERGLGFTCRVSTRYRTRNVGGDPYPGRVCVQTSGSTVEVRDYNPRKTSPLVWSSVSPDPHGVKSCPLPSYTSVFSRPINPET